MILYGPPTSGKDTITAELSRVDERFTLLTKLKVGTGRSTGYRYVSDDDLKALRLAGRLVVETHRYGNRYAVDRHDIDALADAGRVPVVHMGNLADLNRLRTAAPLTWTAVLLWVPREVCFERSRQRGDRDSADRVRAWEETLADLETAGDASPFALTIRTDETAPTDAARRIVQATEGLGTPSGRSD